MYQQLTVIGNLGADPTLRQTPSGEKVCNFTVAANRAWTSASGEKKQETTWYRVTTWENQAAACNQYLRKGSRVLVIAEDIQISTWITPEGEARGIIEVTPRKVKFLSSREDDHEEEMEA